MAKTEKYRRICDGSEENFENFFRENGSINMPPGFQVIQPGSYNKDLKMEDFEKIAMDLFPTKDIFSNGKFIQIFWSKDTPSILDN